MTAPIRVMLVDDHPIVRDGLRAMLMRQEQMLVVGEAPDGEGALVMAGELQPDVVVMDIGLPGISGLEATRQLRALCPATRVLILTVYDNREYALRAARVGARGYLVKNTCSDVVMEAITRIHAGETVFPPGLRPLLEDGENPPAAEATSGSDRRTVLSRRQREVLALIAEGLSNLEIAARLSVSERTIESHRRQICRRLRIRTVAGLTKHAIAASLTRLD